MNMFLAPQVYTQSLNRLYVREMQEFMETAKQKLMTGRMDKGKLCKYIPQTYAPKCTSSLCLIYIHALHLNINYVFERIINYVLLSLCLLCIIYKYITAVLVRRTLAYLTTYPVHQPLFT